MDHKYLNIYMGKNSKNSKKTDIDTSKYMKIYLYHINGIKNKSAAIIKPIGSVFVPDHTAINDEHLKSFEIRKNVYGHIFKCSVSDSFLISTKKYPVAYVIIEYYKSLLRCNLFRLYLFFTVSSDVYKETELINCELNGKFNFEVAIDDNHRELNVTFDKFEGTTKLINKLEELVKSKSISPIIDDLIADSEKVRQEQYGEMFLGLKIPTVTLSLKDIPDSESESNDSIIEKQTD